MSNQNDDDLWRDVASQWQIRSDTIYLNHGSFGPPPGPVRTERRAWQERLETQPMDFFVRQYEPAWQAARQRLADFVGAAAEDLVFVENATAGMNIVSRSVRLRPGDEVLLTDHAYGAVVRIWDAACARAGAERKMVDLPRPVESADQLVAAVEQAMNVRTRLLVISHVTSATALVLPVEALCRAAAARGVPVCVDGPHAPLHVPLDLHALDCDYYTASCHKWLSAPFGSGFLYVHRRSQSLIEPSVVSWGRLLPAVPERWYEQFIWSGTRDPSAYLSVPAAIDFFTRLGVDRVRQRMYDLADYARGRLLEQVGVETVAPADSIWYGAMAHVRLSDGDCASLQQLLWDQYRIEVPIIHWHDRRYVRVSCHLYNTRAQIDQLVDALSRHAR
jgi:isopenicillin-N epimerase